MDFLNRSFFYGVLAGASALTILKWICARKKPTKFTSNQNQNLTSVSDNYVDCLLFSPSGSGGYCQQNYPYLCLNSMCSSCNFNRLLGYIQSAKHSLDVCMYLITSERITKEILNLFRKGIFVKIIVDQQMSVEARHSKLYVFIKEHIPVKVVSSDVMMHNKFVIIDKILLITGSLNWTTGGLFNNYENAVIIYKPSILYKYNYYFLFLWSSFRDTQ